MEFHHRDPNEKEFSLSKSAFKSIKNLERAKKELDKCDLLCSNCHREEHYDYDFAATKERVIRKRKTRKCKFCEKEFEVNYNKKFFCSRKCCGKYVRETRLNCRISRPTKEYLEQAVLEKSMSSIAKDFDVCDSTVARWFKDYKLERPCPGYWSKKRSKKNKEF